MNKKVIATFLLPVAFGLSACKTQQQIQREQIVDNLSIQMQENQTTRADFTLRIQELEQRLAQISGKLEETKHEESAKENERITELETKIQLMEEQNKNLLSTYDLQKEELTKINEQLKEQKEFLDKVLSTLGEISKKPSKSSAKSSKKKVSPYEEAMQNYKRGKYSTAKSQMLAIMDDKDLSAKQRAHVYHNLGMVCFMDKKDEEALIYFSKLYTSYPGSWYNANGLLVMAKVFKRMDQKEQAKQTLSELIEKFPKSKKVAEAKKLLKTL